MTTEGQISADYLTVTSFGSVSVNTDIGGLSANNNYGNISINNQDLNSNNFSLLLNDGVVAANGDVSVTSDASIIAAFVQGNSINLSTTGEAGVELQDLTAFNEGAININSARNIIDRAGYQSVVNAGSINLLAGLNVNIVSEWIGTAFVSDNQSVIIDENYTGSLQINVPGDIIIDKAVVAAGDVSLAASNIIFTDKGSLVNLSGGLTALSAMNSLSFVEQNPGPPTLPVTIQAGDITINAGSILGSENLVISGRSLDVTSDTGLVLNTQVDKLSARVLGSGDLEVNALSSIELTHIDIFDGSITVDSAANIIAQYIVIQTDSYSSSLNLLADGMLSIGQIQIGQLVTFNAVAAGGASNVNEGLIIDV